MVNIKLSQIAPALAPPGPNDQIVGVTAAGPTDVLFPVSQLGTALSWFNVNAYVSIAAAYAACAASGGILYFPKGTYTNGGATLVVADKNVHIFGDGDGYGSVSNLQFPVQITGNNCSVTNVNVSNTGSYGINIHGAFNTQLRGLQISRCANVGLLMDDNGPNHTNTVFCERVCLTANFSANLFMHNAFNVIFNTLFSLDAPQNDTVITGGQAYVFQACSFVAAGGCALSIAAAQYVYFANGGFDSASSAVVVGSGPGDSTAYVSFLACEFAIGRVPPAWNSGTTYFIPATVLGSDNKVYSTLIDNNVNHNPTTDGGVHWWLTAETSTGDAGCKVNGATQTRFVSCDFQNSGTDGLAILAGSTFTAVLGCAAVGNSTAAANISSGIHVGAGVTDFTICDNQCSNLSNLSFGTQRYGIVVDAGASDRYTIRNNLVHGNATAGVLDGGSGVNKIVDGNF